jgi:hypothetical protein
MAEQQEWREMADELWRGFRTMQAELDQRFKETDAQFKATDQKLNRLEGLFGLQWGRLIEALVQPNAVSLFQEWGIQVHRWHQRSKSQLNGETMELDIILENSDEVAIVEVKTSLHSNDVQDFLTDFGQVKRFFPSYEGYRIYGAVAGLEIGEEAARYAYRQGLFVVQVRERGWPRCGMMLGSDREILGQREVAINLKEVKASTLAGFFVTSPGLTDPFIGSKVQGCEGARHHPPLPQNRLCHPQPA